jgi:OOP family OmpA-OmpF porin
MAIAAGLFSLGLIDVAILDVVVVPRFLAERQHTSPAPVIESPPAVEREPEATPSTAPTAEPVPQVPASAPGAQVAEARPALPELAPLLFKRDKVKLEKKVREELAGVLDAMRAQPDLHVVLIGHTDDLGPSKVNRRLSARRARIVSYWLQNRGVAPDRIEVVGQGAGQPVDDERSAAARARNRRVEVEWRWTNQGEP